MRSFPAPRAIFALLLREVATIYGRTPGGYLWAFLEPVAAVAMLAAVFALAFDTPPLGRDFPLFYASGYLPFAYYSDMAQKVGVAIRFSRPLMAYPAVTWLDAILARFLLNSLTHITVIAVVFATMIRVSGADSPNIFPILGALALAGTLGLGIGSLNAFCFERWPVWERLWAILNRPTFLISGVLFLPDALPPPYHEWIWLNPLAHVVTQTRVGLYPGYQSDEVSSAYVLGWAAISFLFGLLFLRRYAREILGRI